MRLLLLVLLACLSACEPLREFPKVVQISAVTKLELAGDHIYFNEAGGLKRVPKTGTASIEVISSASIIDFAATPGHVYAATPSGVLHFALSSAGTVVSMTPVSNDSPLVVAADQNGVSWVTCTTLNHASLDGTGVISVQLTGTCANTATRLALDSSTAYGINAQGQWYASRSGGAPKALANEKCARMAAAGGWLYCSDEMAGLRRFSPHTTDVELVFDGQVHAFAIGESNIYAGVGQDLVSSPRNTSRVDVMGTLASVSAIVLDSTNVYFVNTEGNLGLLLRTPL